MSAKLGPLTFVPRYVPKPWGGRRLAEIFGKDLPPHVPIGESWEVADLPEFSSTVRSGPHAGRTLRDLLAAHGRQLLGDAPLRSGRFPLLIKFLDATEDLSVQVHPRPGGPAAGEVKNEAWIVLHADPDAAIYAGFAPGVQPADVASAAGTGHLVDLLARHPVSAGDAFYLASGTVHALGKGIVVAEVQTPSDTTYRLYDWDRQTGGVSRPLHVAEGLANIDWPANQTIARITPDSPAGFACESFEFALRRLGPDATAEFADRLALLVGLRGGGELIGESPVELAPGGTILVPAETRATVRACTELIFLQVFASQTG